MNEFVTVFSPMQDFLEKSSAAKEAGAAALSSLLGKPVDSNVVEKNSFGNPFHRESVAFVSLSHSDDLVAAAASFSRIGVDCEPQDRVLSKELIRRVFTQAELGLGLTPVELWCCKEAVSKALGIGLGMDFRTIKICKYEKGFFAECGSLVFRISLRKVNESVAAVAVQQ